MIHVCGGGGLDESCPRPHHRLPYLDTVWETVEPLGGGTLMEKHVTGAGL